MTIRVTPHPLSTKMNKKLLFKNNRICKHEKNCKSPSPPPFYVDVINVCSLCYGKCIMEMKHGPSVIKIFEISFQLDSYTIQFLKLLTFSPSDFILSFLFFSLFLIPSIPSLFILLWTYTSAECPR